MTAADGTTQKNPKAKDTEGEDQENLLDTLQFQGDAITMKV